MTAERFKQSDNRRGYDPVDGRAGRKGPKEEVGKHAWTKARKVLRDI